MHSRLNIPLEGSSRSSDRIMRIALIAAGLFISLLVLWAIFRFWTYRDVTSGLRPAGTTASVRIYKTPQTARLISENIGNEPVLPGGPWTFEDILELSDSAFSLHIGNEGVIGVTIDNELNEATVLAAESLNLEVHTNKNSALISDSSGDVIDEGLHFRLHAVLPWTDAELTDHASRSRGLNIHRSGISIRRITTIKPQFALDAPESTDVWARIAISPDEQLITSLFAPIQGNANLWPLFTQAEQSGIELLYGEDDFGFVFQAAILTSNISVEELAGITQEMIKPFNLSTLVSTTEDGTLVEEVRFSDDEVNSTIKTEGEVSLITVTDDSGHMIRATHTPSSILLSNREISLTSEENSGSSCDSGAHSFINIDALIHASARNDHKPLHTAPSLQIPLLFSEIAFTSRKTVLCW